MRTQTKPPWPSVGGLWSLFWRAIVLTPITMLFGLIWITAWVLLFFLPLLEILYLWLGLWLWASVTPVVWILPLVLTRSRWFKTDRRDFLNSEENI